LLYASVHCPFVKLFVLWRGFAVSAFSAAGGGAGAGGKRARADTPRGRAAASGRERAGGKRAGGIAGAGAKAGAGGHTTRAGGVAGAGGHTTRASGSQRAQKRARQRACFPAFPENSPISRMFPVVREGS